MDSFSPSFWILHGEKQASSIFSFWDYDVIEIKPILDFLEVFKKTYTLSTFVLSLISFPNHPNLFLLKKKKKKKNNHTYNGNVRQFVLLSLLPAFPFLMFQAVKFIRGGLRSRSTDIKLESCIHYLAVIHIHYCMYSC